VELLADLANGSRPAPELLSDALALYQRAKIEFSEVDLAEVVCMIIEAAYSSGNRSFLEAFAPQLSVRARSMTDHGAAVALLAVCATTYALYIDARAATAIAIEATNRSEETGSVIARIRARSALGATWLASGLVDRAIECFAAAIRLTEACGLRQVTRGLHNNYAVALMEQHKLLEAESLLRQVLAASPSHARLNAHGNLVLCLLEAGKGKAAAVAADRMALDNAVFGSDLADAVSSLARGTLALETDDVATAIGQARSVSRVIDSAGCTINDRSYFDIFLSRADRLAGRFSDAISRLERGIVRSRTTNVLASLRLEVELASALFLQDGDRARAMVASARSRAAEIGALGIIERADRAMTHARLQARS